MRPVPALIRYLSLLPWLAAIGLAAPVLATETGGDAESLFISHCAACHGERGDGQSRARSGLNPPPRDFTSGEARNELDRARMIRSVTEGRPGTAMVGWAGRLSDQQIAALVDYIRERFMAVAAETPRARPVPVASAAPGTGESHLTGREIYRQNCASCHGDQGTGATWTMSSLNPPPRDFTRETLPRARMIESVTRGRPGTAMMAFGDRLDEAGIAAVVDYVRAEFMRAAPVDAAPVPADPSPPAAVVAADMGLPFPDGLRGDPGRGGAFYMASCHDCHGEDGDGHGPRAGFIRPPPRDFLSAESRRALNRPALFKAISAGMRGTVMPAWRTVLSEQEIADVAEFVFQAYVVPGQGGAALLEAAKKKARGLN